MRLLAFLALFAVSVSGLAQEWPVRPVKFVSPYPPGGSVDPLARLLGARLSESLKQQFIVETRTGASGIIGTDYVAKSTPDGYTFVFIFDTHSVHQSLNAKLPFDPVKDFAPVMIVGSAPMAITTAPLKPYKTFAELVAAAKARPDAITIGNVGNGSIAHLASILVMQAAGIKLAPVPFSGGGPMSTAAMGGHLELAMASVAAQKAHIQGGKLRALVQTGAKRSHTLPDVPTLAEQGLPGITAHAWWGILAPAGTPRPIIDKLHAELVKAINLPDVNKTLTETLGMEVLATTPEATQQFIAGEMARWGKVVKENNIKAD